MSRINRHDEAILLRLYVETQANKNKLDKLNNDIDRLELQQMRFNLNMDRCTLRGDYKVFLSLLQETKLLLQNSILEKGGKGIDLLLRNLENLISAVEYHNNINNNEIRREQEQHFCTLV